MELLGMDLRPPKMIAGLANGAQVQRECFNCPECKHPANRAPPEIDLRDGIAGMAKPWIDTQNDK